MSDVRHSTGSPQDEEEEDLPTELLVAAVAGPGAHHAHAPARERAGPSDAQSPEVWREARRALVWAAVAIAAVLIAMLAQPILLIVGGLVFAAVLDGGTRLLGRVLPIARGLRLTIVVLLGTFFMLYTFYLTGSSLAAQASALQDTVLTQLAKLTGWARELGVPAEFTDLHTLGNQVMRSLGRVTTVVTSAVGALASLIMILVLGIFIAAEPRLYERGLAWLIPLENRDRFYGTMEAMGSTLRRLMAGRLLGMGIEGAGVGIMLAVGGVPMAGLLGILTGLLAFLPNIGAIISGSLIILVGFSAGTNTGLYALGVYVVVQAVDGYLIVPFVARKAVDLAPALVLGAQILLGTLFGVLGLALADPIVVMIKVALERRSQRAQAQQNDRAALGQTLAPGVAPSPG